MIIQRIKIILQKHINIYSIFIDDLTWKHKKHPGNNNGGHFKITIISDRFSGMKILDRHKLIYHLLKDMIKHEIHALSLETKTIDEFKKSSYKGKKPTV